MNIKVQDLQPVQITSSFELLTDVFSRTSTLHRALKIELYEYRNYLRSPFEQMVEEDLSLVATDSATGKLLGCLIATDFSRQQTNDTYPASKFAPIQAITSELGRIYMCKRKLPRGDAALIDMAAVSDDAKGRGVYQKLRSSLHEKVRVRGYRRVIGELSSSATQHVVLNRLGHRNMAEINFNDFQFNHEYPFATIKEPPSLILSEGWL